MPPFPYKAAAFDVDGTLYNEKRAIVRFLIRRLFSIHFLRQMMLVRNQLRAAGVVENLMDRQARILAHERGEPVEDVARRIEFLMGQQYPLATGRVGPWPQLREVLDWLVERKITLAIFSEYRAEAKLRALGLADYPWKVLVAGEEIGSLKPQIHGFEILRDRLGVAPEEIFYVGDREDRDILPARRLGMTAVMLHRKKTSAQASHNFPDYASMMAWLQRFD
ncbi:MAG: Phosphoglycolate phosphatase [Myxococcota bacterium]|nr:Phosphoglycolate phosphatase [Myxococcota bacterium]